MNGAPQPPLQQPPQPAPTLRRELVAIATLYVVLSILPLLIGLAFAP